MRASFLSMTHDESSTFLNYINQSLWECFYLPVCWGTANLHMLNTLLMQFTVGLWGTEEFVVRLPNLLGHTIYLIYSLLLLHRINSNHWVRICGFLLLNANPYFLEFFSLGRGYGLACAFMMMSCYYLYRYVQDDTPKALIWSYVTAILAVLSNFTFLNYWAALTAVLGIGWLLGKGNRKESANLKSPEIWVIGVSALLLGAMLYYPISFLQALGEFEYGVKSLQETYYFLLNDSIQHQGYFGKATLPVFGGIGLAILLPSIATGLSYWNQLTTAWQRYFFGFCLLVLIFFLALITQRYLLGTNYLVNRKAVIFIPLLGIPVTMALQSWSERSHKLFSGFAIVLSLFILLHASRTYNLQQCREWYYDQYTRDMLSYMSGVVEDGHTAKLGAYWLFSHSSNFYIQTQDLDFVTPIIYEKELRTDRFYEYYYIQAEQADQIHPDYEVEKHFGKIGILYRRKDVKAYSGMEKDL